MPLAEGSFKVWIYFGFIVGLTRSSRPRFDTSTDMRKVLIPPDAEVDSVIFRLRATDEEPDFPLIFNVTATVIPVVRIENLPCTLYNKVCQANVILTRRLSPGKFYDFLVVVRDSKGENNSMQATISVTNGTTPRSKIFLHKPSLIMVPEDAKPGTELDYLIVQSNSWSNKPVYIELWQPRDLFKIIQRQTQRQTQGIITLIGELDFETQSMHTLTMYATDPYTEINYDTRNIVGLQVVVIVQDVQDVPPIFTMAPPLTKINNTVQPGDVILRVHAEDGDKGVPREVTYGLVSEYNPFTTFFKINETSGEISLAKPLEDLAQITRIGTPILLSVVAEEIRHSWDEPPAQATVVEIGILIGEPENSPPYFESDNYICYIEENSTPGTSVQFSNPNSTKVKDDDIGKAGVFTLKLENNNGTFEIAPSVAERSANFVVTVRDNTLLDYETHKSLSFKIFAQEVGPRTNLSASVLVTVFLKDINDNPPEFDLDVYEVSLSENATVGTKVVQVHATDKDTGLFGKIRYTGVSGPGGEAFVIDPESGWISVTTKSEALDREKTEKLELLVEARDEDGAGLISTVKLIVHLLDVNDNAPIFELEVYEFRLNSDMTNFTNAAKVKAIDADAEPPNNEVRYEIIHGNYDNKFKLDEITGELFVREQIRKARHAGQNEMQDSVVGLRREHRFATTRLPGGAAGHPVTTDSSTAERPARNEAEYKTNPIPRARAKRADEKPLFTLTVRAYDLGVPLMSSVAQIHILHGPAPGARIVTFVMPGEQLDPNKAAETLATITGSRVTIQEIRPYVEGNSDLSNNKRSVIVARVEQSNSETLVDIEKIRKNLAANGVGVISGMEGMDSAENSKMSANKTTPTNATHVQSEEVIVYKTENKLLLWMLIILGLILLLALATLILCCICPGCPFYMEPRKRRVHSSETLIVRSDARQKQQVQRGRLNEMNGTWSDKKQAWSADRERRNWEFNKRNMPATYGVNGEMPAVVDASVGSNRQHVHNETVHVHNANVQESKMQRADDKIFVEDIEVPGNESRTFDMDSIRRHEFERGSDLAQKMSFQQVEEQQIDRYDSGEAREQLYYRDGNAEVLRLVTRGEESRGYNGKDLIMQRFIEDQKLRKEQLAEAELGSTDAQRLVQPEIILIPGSLDQRHLESLRSDIQQLIMDRSEISKPRHTQETDPTVPTIEVTRATGKSESGTQQCAMHDMELVRQNTLLTRLLLEKETKGSGNAGADGASYLETQSLPGQVAIATQTDRSAATQTDCRVRSRSDNESEEEAKYKRKFKVKKRCMEDECSHKVKSIWMKSPMSERGRTYIGIKMAARRKMAEISDRRAISPVVLREISESLNGHDHFSSNLEDDEDDERLFHYCRDPIKAKIEVCKETIEISTSSQEEMEHRITRMSQRRKIDSNVPCNAKCKKVLPIEPSFRVLEGDSPRKKMMKVEEKKKGGMEVVPKEPKKPSVPTKKTVKSTKVKELKSTMDATISKILGNGKGQRNVVKPVEVEQKTRKPLKHQAAVKVDSGSSEIEDVAGTSGLQRLQIVHAKDCKHVTSPVNKAPGLKKVATYIDLTKSEPKVSPMKLSRNVSPVKKAGKVLPLPEGRHELKVSPRDSYKHASPVKRIAPLKKVKSSSELEAKSEKFATEFDTKPKKKSQKDESARSLNADVGRPSKGKTGSKKVKGRSRSVSKADVRTPTKSSVVRNETHQESTRKHSKDEDMGRQPDGNLDLLQSAGNFLTQPATNLAKDSESPSRIIICVTDDHKGTMQVVPSHPKEETPQPVVTFPQASRSESGNETGETDSLNEISYTRLEDTEKSRSTNDLDVSDKSPRPDRSPAKKVFQKQQHVSDSSGEEISPGKVLERQFTDDFAKTLTQPGKDDEVPKQDATLISPRATFDEAGSPGRQTPRSAEVSEAAPVRAADLRVPVGADGDPVPGRDKFVEVEKKSPRLVRSDKIESDGSKDDLHVDYESESSDESDVSCRTMLNRDSLEKLNRGEGGSKSDVTQEEGAEAGSGSARPESEINNGKVQQFAEDKHRAISVPEKKVQSTEKPLKSARSVQDMSEREGREATKKVAAEKQKSKSQIETCELSRKDKSSRREDEKNGSKSLKVERKKRLGVTDTEIEKKNFEPDLETSVLAQVPTSDIDEQSVSSRSRYPKRLPDSPS